MGGAGAYLGRDHRLNAAGTGVTLSQTIEWTWRQSPVIPSEAARRAVQSRDPLFLQLSHRVTYDITSKPPRTIERE